MSFFLYHDEEDINQKLNIDDLFEKQQQHDLKQLSIYNKLLKDEQVPIYGSGMQVRDWIYVEDNVDAIITIIQKGEFGERYCVGGENELENITLVKKIAEYLGKDPGLIKYVNDRPGHDLKYSTNISKMRSLGWEPKTNFDSALKNTIEWYKERFKEKNEDRISVL